MGHSDGRPDGHELDLRAIGDALTGAALTTGRRHRLTERNDAFRELFGGWEIGAEAADALPGSRYAPLIQALDRAGHLGEPSRADRPLAATGPSAPGNRASRDCVVTCTPVATGHGPAVLVLATPLPDSSTAPEVPAPSPVDEDQARALRRFEALLAASQQVVWKQDLDGELSLLSFTPDDSGGRLWQHEGRQAWIEFVHPKDRARLDGEMRTAKSDGSPFTAVVRVREADSPDVYRHVRISAAPVLDGDTVLEWVGTTRDAEEEWRVRMRDRILARMTQAPTARDLSEAFSVTSAAVVPELFDALAVFLLGPDRDSAFPSRHGGRYTAVGGRTSVTAPGVPSPPPLPDGFELGPLARQVIDERRTRLLTFPEGRPPDDLVSGLSGRWLERAGATSLALIPVVVDGEPVALASAATCRGNPPPSSADLALLEEVLERMGGPLRRTIEHQSVRATALALQRSLLIPPPTVTGGEVAASYRPASSTAEIGGDWYDALGLSDGTLALTIGDIAGHDLVAATAMSQLHGMLRGIIFDRAARQGPSESLSRLDIVAQGLEIAPLVTAVHVVLRRRPSGHWDAVLSNAGHPPPLLIPATAPARYLSTPGGADPPLCVAPGLARTDWSLELAPGDTLLLYTDGLVEVPGEDIADGLDRLARHTDRASLRALPLAAVIDDLLSRLENQSDDVAIIGFRGT
ncbi:SpoIIE family protein phosphatase [Streptomyces sp. Amel2xC10]|uniref:SpoIIE family protein phosphatase n=1 Tax=Streptomyces sp. Amel2xC10 TaxID=1305826 RepID=UPI000A08E141|nr:SpoIIE family protein phosphatase [Streptomyces sp. Amel2xC10]SMF84745.1 Stage II sporulation protein E (SpoIIE) [Streptomyces sp. Amel2xC10]